MSTYDVVVVGAGIMGCAAAYSAVKQGKTTLLLEQFPFPHTRGSSHGASRIIRTAYPEVFHAKIMKEAYPMWRQLEVESGMKLLRTTGMLVFTSTEHDDVEKYRKTTQLYSKDEVKTLDQKSLSRQFPLMSHAPEASGCYDASAGVLYADRCLQAFNRVFLSQGGTMVDNCKVNAVVPGDKVVIQTDKGNFTANGVVITCGSWSSRLLSAVGVNIPLEPQVIQVCYWRSKQNADHTKMSTFIKLFKENHIYGLPTDEYPGLMKICLHSGTPCDPDCRDQVDVDTEAKDISLLKEFVSTTFPYLVPEPAVKERCLYTNTPDEICVIDSHPLHKNIAYGAGFSGQGFKLAPVIGNMLIDLVDGKTPPLLANEMRANRFKKNSKL